MSVEETSRCQNGGVISGPVQPTQDHRPCIPRRSSQAEVGGARKREAEASRRFLGSTWTGTRAMTPRPCGKSWRTKS